MRVHTHMLIMWLISVPINIYSSCLLYDHILFCVLVSQLLADQNSTGLDLDLHHWILICHSALFHLLSSPPPLSLCLLDRCCDTMTECHLMRFLFPCGTYC